MSSYDSDAYTGTIGSESDAHQPLDELGAMFASEKEVMEVCKRKILDTQIQKTSTNRDKQKLENGLRDCLCNIFRIYRILKNNSYFTTSNQYRRLYFRLDDDEEEDENSLYWKRLYNSVIGFVKQFDNSKLSNKEEHLSKFGVFAMRLVVNEMRPVYEEKEPDSCTENKQINERIAAKIMAAIIFMQDREESLTGIGHRDYRYEGWPDREACESYDKIIMDALVNYMQTDCNRSLFDILSVEMEYIEVDANDDSKYYHTPITMLDMLLKTHNYTLLTYFANKFQELLTNISSEECKHSDVANFAKLIANRFVAKVSVLVSKEFDLTEGGRFKNNTPSSEYSYERWLVYEKLVDSVRQLSKVCNDAIGDTSFIPHPMPLRCIVFGDCTKARQSIGPEGNRWYTHPNDEDGCVYEHIFLKDSTHYDDVGYQTEQVDEYWQQLIAGAEDMQCRTPSLAERYRDIRKRCLNIAIIIQEKVNPWWKAKWRDITKLIQDIDRLKLAKGDAVVEYEEEGQQIQVDALDFYQAFTAGYVNVILDGTDVLPRDESGENELDKIMKAIADSSAYSEDNLQELHRRRQKIVDKKINPYFLYLDCYDKIQQKINEIKAKRRQEETASKTPETPTPPQAITTKTPEPVGAAPRTDTEPAEQLAEDPSRQRVAGTSTSSSQPDTTTRTATVIPAQPPSYPPASSTSSSSETRDTSAGYPAGLLPEGGEPRSNGDSPRSPRGPNPVPQGMPEESEEVPEVIRSPEIPERRSPSPSGSGLVSGTQEFNSPTTQSTARFSRVEATPPRPETQRRSLAGTGYGSPRNSRGSDTTDTDHRTPRRASTSDQPPATHAGPAVEPTEKKVSKPEVTSLDAASTEGSPRSPSPASVPPSGESAPTEQPTTFGGSDDTLDDGSRLMDPDALIQAGGIVERLDGGEVLQGPDFSRDITQLKSAILGQMNKIVQRTAATAGDAGGHSDDVDSGSGESPADSLRAQVNAKNTRKEFQKALNTMIESDPGIVPTGLEHLSESNTEIETVSPATKDSADKGVVFKAFSKKQADELLDAMDKYSTVVSTVKPESLAPASAEHPMDDPPALDAPTAIVMTNREAAITTFSAGCEMDSTGEGSDRDNAPTTALGALDSSIKKRRQQSREEGDQTITEEDRLKALLMTKVQTYGKCSKQMMDMAVRMSEVKRRCQENGLTIKKKTQGTNAQQAPEDMATANDDFDVITKEEADLEAQYGTEPSPPIPGPSLERVEAMKHIREGLRELKNKALRLACKIKAAIKIGTVNKTLNGAELVKIIVSESSTADKKTQARQELKELADYVYMGVNKMVNDVTTMLAIERTEESERLRREQEEQRSLFTPVGQITQRGEIRTQEEAPDQTMPGTIGEYGHANEELAAGLSAMTAGSRGIERSAY